MNAPTGKTDPSARAALEGEETRPGARRRILLVEDEPAHAEVVRRAFQDTEGLCQLSVTGDLASARALVAQARFDLVISDWNLPDGQGVELLTESAEVPPFGLLLMTSHGSERMAVQALKAGSGDFLVKTEETLMEMPHYAARALREWDGRVARGKAEAAVRESLQEKEAMLKEIHHRVQNNLQIVSSLLQLQANEIVDERLLAVFESSQARIRAMAQIHEMLYQSESLARIPLESYLDALACALLATCCPGSTRPKIELRVPPSSINADTAFSFALPVDARGREQVLVVDDDPAFRPLLQRMLQEAGYDASAVASGREALEFTTRIRTSLVVMELAMPEMDGPTVLERLRALHPSLPVIVHTGYLDGGLLARALEHSPFTLLAKPCAPDRLLATVGQVLAARVTA